MCVCVHVTLYVCETYLVAHTIYNVTALQHYNITLEEGERKMRRENEERVERVERNLPVSARVDLLELANLEVYFRKNGYRVRSLSMLVNWGISLLVDILRENEVLEEGERIEKIADAVKYFELIGLKRRESWGRGKGKLSHAIRFESMRERGIDPEVSAGRQYKVLHKKGREREEVSEEAKGFMEEYGIYDVEVAKKLMAQRKKYLERRKKEEMKKARASGAVEREDREGIREGMSREELDSYDKERDREVVEKENREVEKNEMPIVEDRSEFE